MLRVAAFTGGIDVPSARFRVRQYIEALLSQGIHIDEIFSRFSRYPPRMKWVRPLWGTMLLANLFPNVIRSHSYDTVLLQREMLSTFITLEPLTKKPRVLDVDDAIFLQREGKYVRRLAKIADLVICGNNYLADWFSNWNPNIAVIPTGVDTSKYTPSDDFMQADMPRVIGWIGTGVNLRYLEAIEDPLNKVIKNYPNVRLRVICNRRPRFRSLSQDSVEFLPWTRENEVTWIQGMDIGIMPLEDTAWARGKCSFKMLQYMACGLPVVVSPVGMNAEVLAMDNVGFGANTYKQWVEALMELLGCRELSFSVGLLGRKIVQKYFSIDALAPQLAACLKGA